MRISRWIGIGLLAWLWIAPSYAISSASEIDCDHHHCVAMVDAGSTGSRIYLYIYDLDMQANPMDINVVYSKKIKPGLATLAMGQAAMDEYLGRLMQDFPKQGIPVHVFATAGMRLLPMESQEHYYTDIKQWFAAQAKWPLLEARTISGQEEGIYGWLSLNYYLQTQQDQRKPLVGLLEIGGASAQIAFPLETTTDIDANDWVSLTVYGRHIQLFAHSFLGLGVNEVSARTQNLSVCYPQGYLLQDGALAAGDAQQCQTKLGTLLQQTYHVDTATQPALQQNPMSEWYTVASVSAMASHPPFIFSDQTLTPQALLQQADAQFCQQTYQHLLTGNLDQEYVQKNCLIGAYFYGLLVNGYGFNPEQSIHYRPDYDGNWTVGVLLNQM